VTRRLFPFACAAVLALSPSIAEAAPAPHADGAALGPIWVVPFAGILLSIALMPLTVPHFWHRHFGKIATFWAAAFILPFALIHGIAPAAYEVLHTFLLEYLPFIILLTALYTVAGGVRLQGTLSGTPLGNTALLGVGTLLASVMGTTGAAMLLIRPLLRANARRVRKVHVFVFFIFLVANIGGSLTPLGDPPLFLGFLLGVPFFWPTTHLFLPMLVTAIPLLLLFLAIDAWLWRGEAQRPEPAVPGTPLAIEGWRNVALLGLVVLVVLASGVVRSELVVTIYHVEIALERLVANVLLVSIAIASIRFTPRDYRAANAFTWAPILEVAKLFAGIFITIIPALAIIRAGDAGAAAPLVALLNPGGQPHEAAYFWITGLLSAFLDNAPTYLVLFNIASGDAAALTGSLAQTLLAISCGAVFFGAFTYVGNAPNFMVKAICENAGVRMPSFFGYIGWASLVLLPLFVLVTLVFF
jgi:Na+/H+ antiporter NhaD/arsenite permease-like protein